MHLPPGSCCVSYAFTRACQIDGEDMPQASHQLSGLVTLACVGRAAHCCLKQTLLSCKLLFRVVELWVSAQCSAVQPTLSLDSSWGSLQVWHQFEGLSDDTEKLAGIVKVPLDLMPLTSGTPSEPAVVAQGMHTPL